MFISKPYRFPYQYAAVVFGLCMFHANVHAGDWTLTDQVSIGITASNRDNDDGSNDNVFALRVSPGFQLDGRGGRISANVRYGLTAHEAFSGDGYLSHSHDLSATSTAELYEDMVFLHASARTGLSSTRTDSAAVTGLEKESDVRQTWAFTLKPEFRHHLGNYVDIVSNNAFDYVYNDGSQSNGSHSESFNLGITNGSRWNRIPWTISVTQNKTFYEDRADKNTSFSASASYRVNRVLQTNGSIGYSRSDVQSDRSDTSSMTWNLGVDWTPNPRTSLSSSFGYRYYGYTWSGSLKHSSRRSSFQITLNRELSNRRTSELEMRDVLYQLNGEPVLDPFTNQPVVIGQTLQVIPVDEDYIRNAFDASWVLQGRRNSLTVSGSIAKRDYEVSNLEDTTYSVSAGLSHTFAANLSGNMNAGYSNRSQSSTASSDSSTWNFGVGLSRKFSQKTAVSADYSFRQQDGDANNGYTDNRFSLSLNTSFL